MEKYRQLPLPVEVEDPELTFTLGMINQPGNEFSPNLASVPLQLFQKHRYIHPEKGPIPMLHRPDLELHTQRVTSLAARIGSYLQTHGTEINYRRLLHIAYAHDIAEVITGDIITPIKDNETPEETKERLEEEDHAIEVLSELYYPPHLREMFKEHFIEAREQKSLEAQIVKIADKWDGFSETLHEIRCGNDEFLSVLNRYRTKELKKLEKLPLWHKLANDPEFAFLPLPTPEEARALPSISLETYREKGQSAFWQDVMHPDLPLWHKVWLNVSLMGSGRVGTPLFSGWKDEIGHQDKSAYSHLIFHENGKFL